MKAVVLVALIALAGCATPRPASPEAEAPAVPLPVIDRAPAFDAPVVLMLDDLGLEEPLAAHDDAGNVYVVAPIGENALFKGDGSVYAPVTTEGLRGRDDASLFADENGTLYWMGLDSRDGTIYLPFQLSRDQGKTWSDALEFAQGEVHRAWAAARHGRVVAVWVDRAGDAPDRLMEAHSADGGSTFSEPRALVTEGFSLPGAILASREVDGAFYVAFSHYLDGEGTLRLARTFDAGVTWDVVPINDDATVMPFLAEDDAGTLYVAYDAFYGEWTCPPQVPFFLVCNAGNMAARMGVSSDRGATWHGPVTLSPPGTNGMLPNVVAGASGRVAIAYYVSEPVPDRGTPTRWWLELAVASDADGDEPTFFTGRATVDPAHIGTICNQCSGVAQDRSRLDHLGITLDGTGSPVVAWVADRGPTSTLVEVVASRADVRLR